ncbi:MAG: hypothetical protein Q9190_007594 [Brigantiaea leucoxantha]
MENNGLKKYIVKGKKRRKRGKPLILDFDTNADDGGRFYSPEKVRRARDREDEKAIHIAAQRCQREVEKAEKAQALEERKAMRANAKEAKQLELAEKRRQKADSLATKQADQQLQNELQSTAKKGKKRLIYRLLKIQW